MYYFTLVLPTLFDNNFLYVTSLPDVVILYKGDHRSDCLVVVRSHERSFEVDFSGYLRSPETLSEHPRGKQMLAVETSDLKI